MTPVGAFRLSRRYVFAPVMGYGPAEDADRSQDCIEMHQTMPHEGVGKGLVKATILGETE